MNTAFCFPANRDSAFDAETKSLRPIDNRVSASLYSDLVEPCVARFGEGLDEIEETTIAFLPIVKGQVTNLDRWDTLIFLAGSNRASFQCRDAEGKLGGRPWGGGCTECAWVERNTGSIRHGVDVRRG